jgi:hypothetical protein
MNAVCELSSRYCPGRERAIAYGVQSSHFRWGCETNYVRSGVAALQTTLGPDWQRWKFTCLRIVSYDESTKESFGMTFWASNEVSNP